MINLSDEFSYILINDKKDNTYKFALARFLLDYVKEVKVIEDKRIAYKEIAESFLKYYWNQVVVYKLKQDFKTKKTTLIVKIIEEKTKDINELYDSFFKKRENQELKEQLIKEIYSKCLADVIPRFQRDSRQNIYKHNARQIEKANGGIRYYLPENDKRYIIINAEAVEEIKKHYSILLEVVILEWAKFLEKTNFTPRLIEKVQRINNPQRNSLNKYKSILLSIDENLCFYCEKPVEQNNIHIDHFIPWSYIFEDNTWNLVLSCSKCNLKKSNYLPSDKSLTKLKARNNKLKDKVKEDIIDNYYNSCKKAGFLQRVEFKS